MIENVEIYPYKNKVRKKTIHLDNIHSDAQVFEYAHDKYLELFDQDVNIEDLVSKVLLELIRLTNSKDGFIALVEQEDGKTVFRYYCVYMDMGGMSFKSQVHNCKISLENESLLTFAILKRCIVISNKVSTDPRSVTSGVPAEHLEVNTFLGLPLLHDNEIIGQIGFSNAKEYTIRTVEKIFPLIRFCSDFIHLWTTRQLAATKEIELKKEVNTLKDSFIAAMSHEIRTPLNGIVGMSRLLSETENLTEKQERYLGILADCSVQLMELVNDILDYSKMSAGDITLHNQPFNLKTCITKAIDIVSQRAEDKNIKLHVDIPANLPENVTGDARRLKQVLFNILTNAIKFTEVGYVKLSVNYQDIQNDDLLYSKSKKINFTIEDTGVGIKAENHKKIFQVFSKITKDDHININTNPGAGLGLSISKFIVEEMGGDIMVQSDGINGCTFSFYVILEDETDIAKLLNLHDKELKNKTAIIVDDTEDNRIFLMDALYSWGIQTISFSSARETLNYVEKRPKFDIAIVDLCMPNMSGLELVQALRERGFKQPVIGLSSIGSDLHGQDWFDYFTTKPASKSKLFNLVLRCFIEKETNAKKSFEESPEPENSEFKILVAEDDYYNQILITELLSNMGYANVEMVSNGAECVDKAKNHHYDVCLMDIKMPVMDGLDATRRIKKLHRPPVIIAVSASVLDSDKNQCFAAGMDGYIAKPIQKEQLESVLKNLKARKKN